MDIICAIVMMIVIVAFFGGVTLALRFKIRDLDTRCDVLNTSLNLWIDELGIVNRSVDAMNRELTIHIRDHNKNVADSDGVKYWTNTRVISRDQFYLDHSSRKAIYTLYYHENADRLEAVYDDIDILEPVALVGNYALKHFGERSGDPNTVYVRNITFNTDFKIVKVNPNNLHD